MQKFSKTIMVIALSAIFSLQLFAQTEENIERKKVDLPDFTGVEVGHLFKVLIQQGEINVVELETNSENLDKVKFTVKDGGLKIENNGLSNPERLIIYLTVNNLKHINASSASTIKGLTPIKGDQIMIEASGASEINLELNYESVTTLASGASNITLKGKATTHDCQINGAAQLKAPFLFTNTTNIDASGAAYAQVNAENDLQKEVSGMAKVETEKSTASNEEIEEIEEEDIKVLGRDFEIIEEDEKTIVKIGELDIEIIDGEDTEIYIGDSKMKIDKDGNVDVKKKKKRRKFNGHFAGIEIGQNNYLYNANLKPQFNGFEDKLMLIPHKSIQLNINVFEYNINLISNRLGLTTGLGFTWNNYVFDNNDIIIANNQDELSFIDPIQDINYDKSKIKALYATVPLMLEFQTNRHNNSNSFHISAGAQIAYNLNASARNEFTDKVTSTEIDDKIDIHKLINDYRVEAIAKIGWGKLNFFATYSLDSLFEKDKGPEVVPVTVGLTLWNW